MVLTFFILSSSIRATIYFQVFVFQMIMSAMTYPTAWTAAMKRGLCAQANPATRTNSPAPSRRTAFRNVGDATAIRTAWMGLTNVGHITHVYLLFIYFLHPRPIASMFFQFTVTSTPTSARL